MRESESSDGSILIIVFAAIILLIAGGGALFMWQRQRALVAMQQEAVMAREVAQTAAEYARRQAAQLSKDAANTTADSSVTIDEPSASSNSIDFEREEIETAIRQVLAAQQQAWNEGDIEQFMESYWKSEDLTFSSGGKLTRSWRNTLENYHDRYPSREAMGQLAFQNLEIRPLGVEAALVLGEWQLTRESQDVGGNFSLVFRNFGDAWVIVHDHTSRRDN